MNRIEWSRSLIWQLRISHDNPVTGAATIGDHQRSNDSWQRLFDNSCLLDTQILLKTHIYKVLKRFVHMALPSRPGSVLARVTDIMFGEI